MGSRRTMPRSHSANGRSGHGSGITGNSRPGGCSYLSNVRPENRSTLCSVIAQLTQETQPTFVTTLKSKAVSESSDVKFFCVVTGYPIPQLTWYKDDKQMDRFCGLPKYEIFRNGQNHSLHIYNCTVEDAAIYQVSASNSKGIVSCSGVLEVGGMNEFKIHQRYFAKLKQKTDGRGKEVDGKENQEPIRTISPERSQRKRRSTMEPFLSTPSAVEDEVTEEVIRSVCEDPKVRLEEPAEEPLEEQPPGMTKTCGKANIENGIVAGIAKTPFAKKKIKIGPRGERTPEEMKETGSEELMEVESCRNTAERKNRATLGKLSRNKSSEALRSPQGSRKDKESFLKRDEKVSEKNPRIPSRLQNAPQAQQPLSQVRQHTSDIGSVNGIIQNKAALHEQTSDPLPQKETKAKQKNASAPSEVTQAPTWMSGNDASVKLKPPPDRRLAAADARPQQKTPTKGAATTEDARLHSVTPIVKSPQQRQHHSKGLRESHSVPQKSQPLSFTDQKSPADLVVKCVDGIEVQGHRKDNGKDNKRSLVPKEKTVKISTETTVAPIIQQPEYTRDKVAKVANPMVVSNKDKKPSSLKPNPELQFNKQTKVETADPYKKTQSLHEKPSTDFQEIPKPENRVISVAELMRAQIKALDSPATSSAKNIPAGLPALPAAADKSQNLRINEGKCTAQEKNSEPGIIPKISANRTNPKEHIAQQNPLAKNTIPPKGPSPFPSSPIDYLSTECYKDVSALPQAGSSNNFSSDPMNPKEIPNQGRMSLPDSTSKNHVDRTSPKNNLVKQSPFRKNRTLQEPSLCPSSVIDPLRTEGNQDVASITNVDSLNNSSVAPVNPKQVEPQPIKSLPDSIPKNHVNQTSPKKNLVKQSPLRTTRTLQEPSLCPSSVIDPLGTEGNQNIKSIPDVGSLSNSSFVPANFKAVENKTTKSVLESNPKIHVDRTSPKENPVGQNHAEKKETFQEDSSLCPSSVVVPFSKEGNRDVRDIRDTGPLNNYSFVSLDPKEVETQPKTSVPDSTAKNSVDQIAPKENLVKKSYLRKNTTFQEDSSLCSSSVIDPLSVEGNQDVTEARIADSLNTYSFVPVNPKEVETQTGKSVPDSISKNHVNRTSSKENLLNQNNLRNNWTYQEPSLCPSSVVDPISIETNRDVRDTREPGSLNVYRLVSVNPKEMESEPNKLVPDSTNKNSVDQTSPKEDLLKQSNLKKTSTFQEDSSPCPSAIDPLSIEGKQEDKTIPHTSSSKTNLSVSINPKEEVTERSTSKTKIQGKNVGLVDVIPVIKYDADAQQETTERTSQTVIIEDNPPSSSLGVLRFPSKSVHSAATEDCLEIQKELMVEAIEAINFLPNSEANLLLQKGSYDSSFTPATPQELASGARRKMLSSKDKIEETNLPYDQPDKQEVSPPDSALSTSTLSTVDCSQQSQLQPSNDRSSLAEKRSPMLGRKNLTAVTKASSQVPNEDVQNEKTVKDRWDPCKAPQVIRKIRSESFADASGHLKLWCQFFNILTDSTIAWCRDQFEIARIKKSVADESQVNLAIVQASNKDSGVYKCTITNDYGTDSTEFLLSPDILVGISLRDDHSVGEEIEMAPLVFSKGVADSGVWGSNLFGRVMVHKSPIGTGCAYKVWRAKVIYGLEPVFESGHTCIIKARRHIAYGGKEEHGLIDTNLDFVKQDCKIQNLAREYCKIFSAEARIIENFGSPLEIIPVYLMYRPANTIPYATVEADLAGVYHNYVAMDHSGRIEIRTNSEVALKCCALQHWIFQWTNGNLLITRLKGVDTMITSIGLTVKYTGHQVLQMEGNPQIFEGFVSQHQCNYYCGLLGLRSLKLLDSLTAPTKPKGSRSPLLQRKSQAPGSCSPQAGRRAAGSPRTPRKTEQDAPKSLKAAVEVAL